MDEREQILDTLRSYWPEAGGQSAHAEFVRARAACADALLASRDARLAALDAADVLLSEQGAAIARVKALAAKWADSDDVDPALVLFLLAALGDADLRAALRSDPDEASTDA